MLRLTGVEAEAVSDRTFLVHLAGKLAMRSRIPLKTRDDLSMASTPGVIAAGLGVPGTRVVGIGNSRGHPHQRAADSIRARRGVPAVVTAR